MVFGPEGSLAGHVVGLGKSMSILAMSPFLQEVYAFIEPNVEFNSGLWGYGCCGSIESDGIDSRLSSRGDRSLAAVVNVDGYNNWLNNMWEKNGVTNYFGAVNRITELSSKG